ncbi:hypothetical protein [Amycolatopsis speibonae]|uniref:Uncharacterized protein n=1 Tax=Amycolatopsis speibonae TaxID=1450224 RepID=A0ABV7P216_9PSEU
MGVTYQPMSTPFAVFEALGEYNSVYPYARMPFQANPRQRAHLHLRGVRGMGPSGRIRLHSAGIGCCLRVEVIAAPTRRRYL